MGRKRNNHRQVDFKYEFDRLGKQKMELAYDILLSKLMKDYEKDMEELVYGGKKQ